MFEQENIDLNTAFNNRGQAAASENLASTEQKELTLHELVKKDVAGSHKEAIRRILDKDPALVNQSDQDGNTPFIHAIKSRYIGIVQLFLVEGSQVKLKQRNPVNGRIALHEAVVFATTEIIHEIYKRD